MTPSRLLLVDDQPVVREQIGELLRDRGHLVDTVETGEEALLRLRRRRYDLALLDVQLPGINGLALLARIRIEQPTVPAVLFSGRADVEMVTQALRLGAADFLEKPIHPEELTLVIERLLDHDTPAPPLEDPDVDDERTRILAALEETRWNRKQAARLLGLEYKTLLRRMKSFHIS